jgi:Uma2 family endonuclease
MTVVPKLRFTVDEFLAWAEGRPGRYELVEGEVVQMSPERARHARTKAKVHGALAAAVQRSCLECEALPDGMTVRITARTAFEPDALVYCGPAISGDALEVESPVIVVEVLSPSTGGVDTGAKLTGYFGLASVQHYLIIDADSRVVIHHRRGSGEIIETRILAEGALVLEPPGMELEVADLFPPA